MDNKKLRKEVSAEYKAAKDSLKKRNDRIDFNTELYTGYKIKSKMENSDNIAVHVPYVKTLLDNVFPLLTAKLPISKVTARDSGKSYGAARLMDRLVNYTFDVNNFEKKYMMAKKESMLAGDAFTMVIWSPDPEKNHPLLININTKEFYPHVNKLDIDDEWPVYIKREMTKRQMKEMGWNKKSIESLSESKLGNKSYRRNQLRNLGLGDLSEEVKANGKPKDDLYEVCIRLGMMKFGKGEEKEQKMGMVVVANDEEIINTDPVREDLEPFESPYKNNVMNIAHLPYDPLPNTMLSQSFIDPIASHAVELNDLEAMKRSNYYRRNNPPIIVDKDGEVDLSTLKFQTGLPWLVKGGANRLTPYILPDLAPAIQNDKMMIKQEMQNVTGASDFLNPTPDTITKGNKSAAHSNIMNENTKMRFRPQAVYEDRYMEKIGKILINMWQDKNFFDEEVALAITDDEGESEITMVKHDMVEGELDFVVQSASSVAQSDTAVLGMAVQALELFIQDPTIDPTEFKRVIIDKSGFDPNKIMKPKVGMLPELVSRLNMLTFITQQPDFNNMPGLEKAKILDRIHVLSGLVKELQAKAQAQNAQPPQPGQPQQGPQPAMAGQAPQQAQAVKPQGGPQ